MSSARPTTSNNFAEIEKLLESLSTPKKLTIKDKQVERQKYPKSHQSKPKPSKQPEAVTPEPSQHEPLNLNHQWDDLINTGVVTDNNDTVQQREEPKKKRKATSNRNIRGNAQKKKKPTPIAAKRKVATSRSAEKNDNAEDSLSIPDTTSEDDDTKGFLEQLKKLAEQKKKSQAAKLARANKRTLAEMEKLGSESKVENHRIAAETSKLIVEHCDKLLTQVKAVDSEFQNQATNCVRVKSESVDSMKKMLERSKNINIRMQELANQFKERCNAISEQAEKDVQAERLRLQKKIRSRAVVDCKLKNLQEFLHSK